MNWFKNRLDPKYVKICSYAAVTTILTIALGLLLYHSGFLVMRVWNLVAAVLEPFVYGLLICYVLLPLVRKIADGLGERGILKDKPVVRLRIAVFITVALVLALISVIVFLLVLVITRSVTSVNLETIQELLSSAEGDITRLLRLVQQKLGEIGVISGEASTSITGAVGEITGILSTVVFSAIFGVYFLLDGQRVFNYARRIFIALFGEYLGPDLSQILTDADAAFSGYLRGQVVDALLVGVETALAYTIIGVPYGPIIGLLTGIGNLIPYVGGPVGYATTILVCLAEGDTSHLIWGLIALSVIMFIDGNVVNPRLLSHAVEVHPLVVIVALIAGNVVGGLAGMLIAVPMAAFLKMQLERWLLDTEEHLEKSGILRRGDHAAPPRDLSGITYGARNRDMAKMLHDETAEIRASEHLGNTGDAGVTGGWAPVDEPEREAAPAPEERSSARERASLQERVPQLEGTTAALEEPPLRRSADPAKPATKKVRRPRPEGQSSQRPSGTRPASGAAADGQAPRPRKRPAQGGTTAQGTTRPPAKRRPAEPGKQGTKPRPSQAGKPAQPVQRPKKRSAEKPAVAPESLPHIEDGSASE